MDVLYAKTIMTTTTSTIRLRNEGESWGEYIEYLDEALFTPAPDRKDYEDFNSYFTALNEHRAISEKNSCIVTLRHLVRSLAATDLPELQLITISYYGGGDSGEIEAIDCYTSTEATIDSAITDDLDKDLSDAFDNFGWRLAYAITPGFEISDGVVDGGTGTISLLLNEGQWQITVDHETRYYQTDSSSYLFT